MVRFDAERIFAQSYASNLSLSQEKNINIGPDLGVHLQAPRAFSQQKSIKVKKILLINYFKQQLHSDRLEKNYQFHQTLSIINFNKRFK